MRIDFGIVEGAPLVLCGQGALPRLFALHGRPLSIHKITTQNPTKAIIFTPSAWTIKKSFSQRRTVTRSSNVLVDQTTIHSNRIFGSDLKRQNHVLLVRYELGKKRLSQQVPWSPMCVEEFHESLIPIPHGHSQNSEVDPDQDLRTLQSAYDLCSLPFPLPCKDLHLILTISIPHELTH